MNEEYTKTTEISNRETVKKSLKNDHAEVRETSKQALKLTAASIRRIKRSAASSTAKRSDARSTRGRSTRTSSRVAPARTQSSKTEQTFIVSTFNNKTDTKAKYASLTWVEFCKRLEKPAVRKDKDGLLFSPATFKNNQRSKANALTLSMLVLDFDHGLNLEYADSLSRELGVPYAIWTTWSHQRKTDKHPTPEDCFRVVFPLREPIPAEDVPYLFDWANARFHFSADKACKDAGRMFYLPVKFSRSSPYEHHSKTDGEFLDWRPIVEAAKEAEAKVKATAEEKAKRIAREGLSPFDDYAERGDIRPLLKEARWEYLADDGDGEQWRRPGKRDAGFSAHLFHESGLFHVFSDNAAPFEANQTYTKPQVYALLKHDGDESAAARALMAEKFGQRPKSNGDRMKTGDKPTDKASAQQGENKYIAEASGLVWEKSNGEKVPLCNFVAEITGEVIRDDGTEQTDVYEITATLNGVPKVGTVTASEFSSLKWVNKLLGARARVYPNREKYVGDAIRALSENIKTRTVVAHTGWRNDGDGWNYYHVDGAISASGLIEAEVSLSSQLENFALVSPPDDAQLTKDVRAIFDDLLSVTPNKPDVMVAGVGEVLCAVFSKPDFSGFDFGTTGTRKSQIQALKQSFFGRKYTDENLPESWKSSEYGLETFASKIKDAAGCIDEFKPEGTGTAREKWHTKADYVLRGAANKQGRTTLRQDRSERPARIPQGLLFCSGEELPNGESLRARLSIKEYDDKTVDLERLTIAQRQAADGVYVRAMSAFIQWLATDSRIETLREQRDEEIHRRRDGWLKGGVNSHGRTANNNAHLEWAWDEFFAFVAERNLINAGDLEEYRALVASALDQHGRNQAKYLVTANDALKFVEFIQNAILSGKAHLTDQKGEMPNEPVKWGWKKGIGVVQAQGTCIGYVNGDEVYLLPDESYRIASDGGSGTDKIRATKDALQKRLREEGLLAYTTETGNPKNNKNTVQKRFKSTRAWMLCFKTSTFIGADDEATSGESAPEDDDAVPFNEEPEQTDNVVVGKFRRLSGVK